MPTGGFLEHKFHMETLLDGEIVMDIMKDGTERLKFLVFDALVVDNKNLMRRSLSTRLGVMMSIRPFANSVFHGLHSQTISSAAEEAPRCIL